MKKSVRTLLGGPLAVLLLLAYPFLHMLRAMPGVAMMLVYFLYYGLFAVALLLMDVVKLPDTPMNLIPATAFVTLLLFYRIGTQMGVPPLRNGFGAMSPPWACSCSCYAGSVLLCICEKRPSPPALIFPPRRSGSRSCCWASHLPMFRMPLPR